MQESERSEGHIMNHYRESKKGGNIHKKQEIKVKISMLGRKQVKDI